MTYDFVIEADFVKLQDNVLCCHRLKMLMPAGWFRNSEAQCLRYTCQTVKGDRNYAMDFLFPLMKS